MQAEIYTDGGARPTNPGHAGFAVLIRVDTDEQEIARYIGWKTNNQAEYYAVIVGLKAAHQMGATSVVITLDSMLVMQQVRGEWQCKDQKLKGLCREAQDIAARFEEVEWVHVRGHQGHIENERVDKLCTKTILEAKAVNRGNNPWVKRLEK